MLIAGIVVSVIAVLLVIFPKFFLYLKSPRTTKKIHVPYAVEAFLESTDFEDCIRNTISIGGDSDTLGAIAGAIAEGFYGVPDEIWAEAEKYLDESLRDLVRQFEIFIA